MRISFGFLSLSCLGLLQIVCAQTYTACDPTNTTCPPTPGLNSDYYFIDFTTVTSTPADWTVPSWCRVTYNTRGRKQGAELEFLKRYDSQQLFSNFYFLFGRVEFVVQAAPGPGIISDMMTLSEDLDEFDWEFRGSLQDEVQTGWFGKGVTGLYNHSITPKISTPMTQFHTYTFDWNPERTVWEVDGTAIRTLRAADCQGRNNQYPQSPSKVMVGLWDAGDPDRYDPWSGGMTPIPPPKEGYSFYVKSVKIKNTHPAACYNWTDKSGSWQSIKPITDQAQCDGQSLSSSAASSSTIGSSSVTSSSATSLSKVSTSISPPVSESRSAASATLSSQQTSGTASANSPNSSSLPGSTSPLSSSASEASSSKITSLASAMFSSSKASSIASTALSGSAFSGIITTSAVRSSIASSATSSTSSNLAMSAGSAASVPPSSTSGTNLPGSSNTITSSSSRSATDASSLRLISSSSISPSNSNSMASSMVSNSSISSSAISSTVLPSGVVQAPSPMPLPVTQSSAITSSQSLSQSQTTSLSLPSSNTVRLSSGVNGQTSIQSSSASSKTSSSMAIPSCISSSKASIVTTVSTVSVSPQKPSSTSISSSVSSLRSNTQPILPSSTKTANSPSSFYQVSSSTGSSTVLRSSTATTSSRQSSSTAPPYTIPITFRGQQTVLQGTLAQILNKLLELIEGESHKAKSKRDSSPSVLPSSIAFLASATPAPLATEIPSTSSSLKGTAGLNATLVNVSDSGGLGNTSGNKYSHGAPYGAAALLAYHGGSHKKRRGYIHAPLHTTHSAASAPVASPFATSQDNARSISPDSEDFGASQDEGAEKLLSRDIESMIAEVGHGTDESIADVSHVEAIKAAISRLKRSYADTDLASVVGDDGLGQAANIDDSTEEISASLDIDSTGDTSNNPSNSSPEEAMDARVQGEDQRTQLQVATTLSNYSSNGTTAGTGSARGMFSTVAPLQFEGQARCTPLKGLEYSVAALFAFCSVFLCL